MCLSPNNESTSIAEYPYVHTDHNVNISQIQHFMIRVRLNS